MADTLAIGIDIGSTCAKTVVSRGGEIVYRNLRPTGWSSVDTAGAIRRDLEAEGLIEEGSCFVATGYGRISVPFADKCVPAVSLARIAGGLVAPIHVRYDTMEVMSMAQMEKDIAFIAEFTRRMAVSAACPVSRTIPESVRKELDEYLFKKRKEH